MTVSKYIFAVCIEECFLNPFENIVWWEIQIHGLLKLSDLEYHFLSGGSIAYATPIAEPSPTVKTDVMIKPTKTINLGPVSMSLHGSVDIYTPGFDSELILGHTEFSLTKQKAPSAPKSGISEDLHSPNLISTVLL